MPRKCVAIFCNNEKNIFLWPNDHSIAGQWTNFVRVKRKDWGPAKSSVLCARHFDDSCYENKLKYEMGFSKK